jgi:prepilin-type N-terminal cleavage/methylation domain-containing protein/prepilin-type processing-associated H-X9-DG protein
MHRGRKAAFTLIELLVVIAVIAIIAAILFPVFARAREKARQATCLSNEKQIASAVLMYMQDYDEEFPFVLDWSANFTGTLANSGDDSQWPVVPGVTGQEPQFQLVNVVASYVKNANIWYCPSVGPDYAYVEVIQTGNWPKGATMRTQGTSYTYTYVSTPWPAQGKRQTFMGGKSYAILQDASRWPMLYDEPIGCFFTGNIIDPPSTAVPHSGGLNVAYGDGHAKFHRLEAATGGCGMFPHIGDGLFPGQ